MSAKLFVGGLAWRTRDDELKRRGFGFVTYSDEESSGSEEKTMSGENPHGRCITVNKPKAGFKIFNNRRDNFRRNNL